MIEVAGVRAVEFQLGFYVPGFADDPGSGAQHLPRYGMDLRHFQRSGLYLLLAAGEKHSCSKKNSEGRRMRFRQPSSAYRDMSIRHKERARRPFLQAPSEGRELCGR